LNTAKLNLLTINVRHYENLFQLALLFEEVKKLSKRPVAIYMRITADGKRSEITTGRSCEPEKWIVATGRINGKKEDARFLNAYLRKAPECIWRSGNLAN
jgi:hypothetical protein